jgi:CubicO group peptidase (beta-lactamase class C family)
MKCAKIIILVTLVLLVVQSAAAQNDKAKKLDDFIAPFAKADQFYGQIVVTENGKVIYDKAFGLANAEYKIPNQTDTRLGIASITKYMTAVILSRMVENNKLVLTDKLSKYIPDFPNGDKITIEMLAHHRSGIPHRVMPPEAESMAYTSAEFIEKVKLAKLAFEPGTQELYSSAGYAVLARVLEIVSGQPYAHLLQEFVFAPAGMTDSVNFDGELVMERRAQDYYPSPYGLINAPLKNYSFLNGAGSVYGSARDVNRFGQAVMDGKYGEALKAELIGKTSLSGSGSTNGHRSYFEIEREQKYGFALVANLAGAFDLVTQGIREIMLGKEVTVKSFAIPKIVANPNKDLNEFLGHYQRSDGTDIEIVLRNGFFYSADIKLYPTAPDCFFEYRYFGNVCFARDGAGKIKQIDWKGANFTLVWMKQ